MCCIRPCAPGVGSHIHVKKYIFMSLTSFTFVQIEASFLKKQSTWGGGLLVVPTHPQKWFPDEENENRHRSWGGELLNLFQLKHPGQKQRQIDWEGCEKCGKWYPCHCIQRVMKTTDKEAVVEDFCDCSWTLKPEMEAGYPAEMRAHAQCTFLCYPLRVSTIFHLAVKCEMSEFLSGRLFEFFF